MTTTNVRIADIAKAIEELTAIVRSGNPLSKEDALALLECRKQFDILKQVDTFVEVKKGTKLMAICDKWEPVCVNEPAGDSDPEVYCAYIQQANRPCLYYVGADNHLTVIPSKATLMTRTIARRAMDELVSSHKATGKWRNSTASEAIDRVAGSVEIGMLGSGLSPEVSTVLTPVVPQEM